MEEPMEEDLDLRGLKCPLPALMARRRLARACAGRDDLTVLASDPLAVVDIPHMCGEEGHALSKAGRAGTTIASGFLHPAR